MKVLVVAAFHSISWNDVAVPGGFEASRVETMSQLYPALRAALPPSRRHIVPDICLHFVSSYEERWVREPLLVDLSLSSAWLEQFPPSVCRCSRIGYLGACVTFILLRRRPLSQQLRVSSWLLSHGTSCKSCDSVSSVTTLVVVTGPSDNATNHW